MNIIFCLPGNQFSGKFLTSWTSLLSHCYSKGYKTYLSQKYNSNVYFVRSLCLNADNTRGKTQIPFNNQIDYDYIMWIDSDIIFTPLDFERLLSHDKDIISGLYYMEGGVEFAAVREWSQEYFLQHGKFQHLRENDIVGKKEPMEVVYNGFGFMLIKKGVFEKIEYPWFGPEYFTIGNAYDFCSEDVGFCLRAQRSGFKLYVDPNVIVKHEKMYLY